MSSCQRKFAAALLEKSVGSSLKRSHTARIESKAERNFHTVVKATASSFIAIGSNGRRMKAPIVDVSKTTTTTTMSTPASS
jgi:hypothetical protein